MEPEPLLKRVEVGKEGRREGEDLGIETKGKCIHISEDYRRCFNILVILCVKFLSLPHTTAIHAHPLFGV
jgi:hypothetical protein